MNRAQKEEMVASIRSGLDQAKSVVLADHSGIEVNTVNELRSEFRANGVTYRVVKNTLAKLAVQGTEHEILADLFRGPTAIAFSDEDAISPAKVAKKFAKEFDAYEIRGGYLDGEILDASGVDKLAEMPTKDEMRAKVLNLFQAVPTKFVRTLNAAPTEFVGLLRARKQDLEESA